MSKTIPDIIEAHGVKRIADVAGVPETNVRMWKSRKRIPVEHWRDLAASNIVTLEELADLAAKSEAA